MHLFLRLQMRIFQYLRRSPSLFLSHIIATSSLAIPVMIINETSLSFLGLGFPPDVPTWGRLLYDAKDLLEVLFHPTIHSDIFSMS
jgi:peptide/nickel transport system permease protein